MKKMKVAISAPYMHQEKSKIEEYLKNYDWSVDWIPVRERLEEYDLMTVVNNYDGIICGDDRFTFNVYNSTKRLKVIVKWGTGIDSLNVHEAEKRNILVYRTPNAFTIPVSESAMALMLSFSRNIQQNDRLMKSRDWSKPKGHTLNESTIGIIGFGDIGQAVALRLKPFGPRVLVCDILDKSKKAIEIGVEFVEFKTLLKLSDYITLHADLNSKSRHLICKNTIGQMVKRPYIVNTARGSLINEYDLIDALKCGAIKGAGLDVFEEEPLGQNSPLRSMDNVILSAHNTNSSSYFWDFVHQNSLKMMQEGLTKIQ